MIPNLKLKDLVVGLAEKNKIPYQYGSLKRGATDGGVIHLQYFTDYAENHKGSGYEKLKQYPTLERRKFVCLSKIKQ